MIAVLVESDTVAFEVGVVQQVFGRRMPLMGTVTGDADSPYEVVLCGERRRHVLPSGVDLGDLDPLERLITADTVMIPGVEDPLSGRSEVLLDSLRAAAGAGARMVSYCGGAFLLAGAGILDGRRATTHWLLEEEFRAMYPQVRLEAGQLYVDDGPVHTSGGVFATMDLALHLLALDVGNAYANDFGRILVTAPRRPGAQAQFVKKSLRSEDLASNESLLQWIRDHAHEPLTLARLASHQHVSVRSLVRKFRLATGMSVFDWIGQERVNRAKSLLETTDYPVGEIAAMVGFGTAETLRRNFDRQVGTTAGAYRAMFRRRTVRTDFDGLGEGDSSAAPDLA